MERPVPKRPHQILQATALFWISTTLGLFAAVLEGQRHPESQVGLAVVMLLNLALSIALSVGLWRGRNWARLLYLILVALSLLNFVAWWGESERPGVEVALEAVSFVADGGSFFLLFIPPGSLWFRPPDEA